MENFFKALQKAKEGRVQILGKILEVIPEPREDFKPNVPRIETLEVPKDSIGAIIAELDARYPGIEKRLCADGWRFGKGASTVATCDRDPGPGCRSTRRRGAWLR